MISVTSNGTIWEAVLHSFSLLNWKRCRRTSVWIISGQPASSGGALKDPQNEGFYIIPPPATLKEISYGAFRLRSVCFLPHTHYHWQQLNQSYQFYVLIFELLCNFNKTEPLRCTPVIFHFLKFTLLVMRSSIHPGKRGYIRSSVAREDDVFRVISVWAWRLNIYNRKPLLQTHRVWKMIPRQGGSIQLHYGNCGV